jgi:hypothetical protein
MSDTENGADRVNGLMAAMGRKETENASLRAKLAEYEGTAQDQGDNTGSGESQPAQEFEAGEPITYNEDGVLEPWSPPTPLRHNEARVKTEPPVEPWDYSPSSKGFPG